MRRMLKNLTQTNSKLLPNYTQTNLHAQPSRLRSEFTDTYLWTEKNDNTLNILAWNIPRIWWATVHGLAGHWVTESDTELSTGASVEERWAMGT